VLSDIRGAFELSKGVMTLSSLSFSVPSAAVTLEGTYGLQSERIDLHGELRLDAKLSDTTTGLKSFLLRLVDPLFKKKDAGAVIPIKIVGTPDKPSFGLEARRVLTRKEVASPVSESDRFRRSIPSCADVLDTSSRDPTQVSRSSSAPLSPGRRRVEPERR
jgi:hypothetical protein